MIYFNQAGAKPPPFAGFVCPFCGCEDITIKNAKSVFGCGYSAVIISFDEKSEIKTICDRTRSDGKADIEITNLLQHIFS